MDAHKASETASLLIGAILGVLVQQGLIPQDYAPAIQSLAGGLIAYALGRIYSKLANGQTPFRPVPKPTSPPALGPTQGVK